MKSSIQEIDTHNLKFLEAKDFIYSEVTRFRKMGYKTIRIIHGFNRGTKIKDWLINSKTISEELSLLKIESDPLNSGSTLIYLK